MPPTERLNDEAVALLEAWIRMGAPFPASQIIKTVGKPSDRSKGDLTGRFSHCHQSGFRMSQTQSGAGNDIDRFVVAELQARGMVPVPESTDYDLVRRLTFQLTGLPPTPNSSRVSATFRGNRQLPGWWTSFWLRRSLVSAGDGIGLIWLDTPIQTVLMRTFCSAKRGDIATG